MTCSNCPTDEEFRRMLMSGGIGSVDDQLGKHIDGCQSCQERLERLAGDLLKGSVLREALLENPEPSRNLVAAIDALSSDEAISNISSPPRFDDLNPWLVVTHADATPSLDGYVLLECVGRGGMGVVFRAIEPKDKQTVALKAMLPELARDGRARDRFVREARAMAAVRHPNVVALHDVSEIDGLPYLVMEYVEGDSLEHRLRNGESMNADEIIRIGAEIAAGVGACHEQGVIHRDIKPSNVLLNIDGAVKVTDFGLATVASTPTLTNHGYLSGTPDYVAPERLSMDTEADERSDLFSLGCLLYTMAAGEPPFGGDTPLITLHRIASQQPPLVGIKNPSIPAHLEQAIASLMAKKPEDRPSSATAAKAHLLDAKPLVQRSVRLNPRRLIGCFLFLTITCFAVFWLWPAEEYVVSVNPNHTEAPAEVEVALKAIDADTITVQTDESLLSAINTAPNGGRIVIDTDSTLVVSPLYIENKSISLAAATGRTPTLQLQIPEDGPAPEYLLRLNSGSLRLDGVRLKDAWTPEAHLRRLNGFETLIEQYGLVSLNEGDIHATRSRFETGTNGSAVKLSPGSEAVMIDCDVLAPSGGAINWHAIDGDELRLEDCVLVGNVGLMVEMEGDAETYWTRTVALAQIAIIEMNWVSGQLTARVSDCILQSAEAMVLSSLDPPTLSGLKRSLAWFGANNQVQGQEVGFLTGEHFPSWANRVTSWAIEDLNSTYDRTSFRFGHQEAITRLLKGEQIESIMSKTAP